jgi:hypothetical protein
MAGAGRPTYDYEGVVDGEKGSWWMLMKYGH